MKKFDLKSFDRVLVRANSACSWRANLFSHYEGDYAVCLSGEWSNCIPFFGNEHLRGTMENYYEPIEGDFVVSTWQDEFSKNEHIKWIAIVEESFGCSYMAKVKYIIENTKVEDVEEEVLSFDRFCRYDENRGKTITRPATKEEKDILLYALQKEGMIYNNTSKKVEDKFKDGDFVKDTDGTIFIYKPSTWKGDYADCYVGYTKGEDDLVYDAHGYTNKSLLVFATREEISNFIEELHSRNKDWDYKNKKLIDWKFIPRINGWFYYPFYNNDRCIFKVHKALWSNDESDNVKLNKGFVFENESGCLNKCNELNKKF